MQIRRLHPDKQDAAVVVSFLSISCRREWDKQEGSTKKYCGLLSLSVPPYILYACPSEPPHVLLAVETPQAPVAAGYLDEEDPPKFYLAPPPFPPWALFPLPLLLLVDEAPPPPPSSNR